MTWLHNMSRISSSKTVAHCRRHKGLSYLIHEGENHTAHFTKHQKTHDNNSPHRQDGSTSRGKSLQTENGRKKKKARLNYVSKKCLYFVTSPPDSTEHQGTPTVIPRNTVVHAETSSTRTLAHNQETAAPSVQPKRQPYTRPNDVWNPPLAYERCKPKIIKN